MIPRWGVDAEEMAEQQRAEWAGRGDGEEENESGIEDYPQDGDDEDGY